MKQNKKIGILTLHRAFNYGAVWQSWALMRVCQLLGYKVEVIDYNPFGDYKALYAIGKRLDVVYRYWKWMYHFNRFVMQRLHPTSHTVSHEWIKNNPPNDDVYIVGSDQVWANSISGDFLDSYLLDFAPVNVKRISYAASTGGNPMELNEYQLGELRKFSAISVRERQSVADVQSKVNVKVADVCDPTLLLTKEEYEAVEKKLLWLPKRYIAYFDLAGDPFCAESARQIGDAKNLPIVKIGGKYQFWPKRNYIAPSPEEWLYIMHHADFICTNSYHGVALSIVYRRQFVFCAPSSRFSRANSNYRIQNLLEQTGLLERYATDSTQIAKIVMDGCEIADKERFISEYRERSLEWLKTALENETNKEW